MLFLEIVAGNTQFAAGDVSKSAFANLIGGDVWMIYRNIQTGILHWDFVSSPQMELRDGREVTNSGL